MTTETSAESQGSENTSLDTQQGTQQSSTDQSQQDQQQSQSQEQANDKAAEEGNGATDGGADASTDGDGGAADGEGGEGKGDDAWAGAELDEETRKFVGDKTPAQIAKELMGAQKLLGKKTIGIPDKDATPEQHRAFHKARGVPEDEAGYDLKPAIDSLKEKAPAGWAPSEEMETAFRKAARMSNMSQSEATEFAKNWLSYQFDARKDLVETQSKAATEAQALLAKAWGPDRTAHEAAFARGMTAIGLDGAGVDVLLDAVAGNGQARFNAVQAITNIGRNLREGGPVPNGGLPPNGAAMTKEQARSEMERIKADPVLGAAYTDVTHARHNEVTAEMTRLGKIERGIS